MSNHQPCKTILIEDVPQSSDAFTSEGDYGAHERVASAIVELMNSTDGGKAIALEGAWGSGKSTIVNMVVSRFSSRNQSKAIIFDTWAHEGDPLRRTFLETIVESFETFGWRGGTNWAEQLEMLSGRRRIVRTKNVRKPGALGVLLAISVMLVPIGTALVTSALRRYSIALDSDLPFATQFAVGMTMSLAPLLAVVTYAAWLFRGKKETRHKLSNILNLESWAFLSSKDDSESVTESSQTPNPTSLEFAAAFREIVGKTLSSDRDRRVLLVIDNLDRTDEHDALEMWSTLQTFLSDARARREEWFKRVWVLVPYDPIAIRKLWKQPGAQRASRTADLSDPIGSFQEPAPHDISMSYFDKSFQVRFKVPPLALTGWKTLLDFLLHQAFPDHSEDDRHKIYLVFDQFRPCTFRAPTPRQLKLFVNQLGVVHRQWQHVFPQEHCAYFAAQSEEPSEMIWKLRSTAFPPKDAERVLGQDLRKNLAALAFNVHPQMGMELLLADTTLELLRSGDPNKQLLQMAGDYGRSFWATMEQVSFTRFSQVAPQSLARIASTLLETGLLDSINQIEVAEIRRGLKAAAESITEWNPLDSEMGNGLRAIVLLVGSESLSRSVIQTTRGTINNLSSNGVAPAGSGQKLIGAMVPLIAALESVGHAHLLPSPITLPLDASEWVQATLVLAADRSASSYRKHFRPIADASTIISHLSGLANSGALSEQLVETIQINNDALQDVAWLPLAQALRTKLDSAQNAAVLEAQSLIRAFLILVRFKQDDTARGLFKELVQRGHLLHLVYRALRENLFSAGALFSAIYLDSYPANQRPKNFVNQAEGGHQLIERMLTTPEANLAPAFVEAALEIKRPDLLFKILRERARTDPFIAICFRIAADHDRANELIPSSALIENWQLLKEQLKTDDRPTRFVDALANSLERSNLADLIIGAEAGFQLSQASLYLDIMSIEGVKAVERISDWCASKLQSLSSEDWLSDFAFGFQSTLLAIKLSQLGKAPSLGTALADAVEKHAIAVRAGSNVPPAQISSQWRILLNCIGDGVTRLGLQQRLMLIASEAREISLSGEYFDLLGEELTDASMNTKNRESILRILLNLLRDKQPESGLRWIIRTLERNEALVGNDDDNLSREIRQRCKEAQRISSASAESEVLQHVYQKILR